MDEMTNTPNLPTLRDSDPKTILQRYLSDESTQDIAASYGVTRQALGQYLLAVAETEWREAQVARAVARKERAEDDLESARQALLDIEKTDRDGRETFLARVKVAEAGLRAAQWDLERTARRIYGADHASGVGNAVQININLRRDGT